MIRILFGLFLAAHGMVHLLYFGHSAGIFEITKGLTWPEGSWAFSGLFGNPATHMIANVGLILSGLVFIVGGAGVVFNQGWAVQVVTVGGVLSVVLFLLMWDGGFARIADKGLFAILINIVVLVLLNIVHWPKLD